MKQTELCRQLTLIREREMLVLANLADPTSAEAELEPLDACLKAERRCIQALSFWKRQEADAKANLAQLSPSEEAPLQADCRNRIAAALAAYPLLKSRAAQVSAFYQRQIGNAAFLRRKARLPLFANESPGVIDIQG